MRLFNKSDLKDGMRVELRNGDKCWLCGERFVTHYSGCNWSASTSLIHLENDLTDKHEDNSEYDIIRVTDRDGTVLFEREPEKVKLELEVTPEQAEAIWKQLG